MDATNSDEVKPVPLGEERIFALITVSYNTKMDMKETKKRKERA